MCILPPLAGLFWEMVLPVYPFSEMNPIPTYLSALHFLMGRVQLKWKMFPTFARLVSDGHVLVYFVVKMMFSELRASDKTPLQNFEYDIPNYPHKSVPA